MALRTIILDCARLGTADAGTIHCIARLRLLAGRRRASLRLANASTSLIELIDLCGLARELGVESRRKPEEREEPDRIEEECDI